MLEKVGWSDETEMLAKVLRLLTKHFFGEARSWEHYLPAKYVGAATYSANTDMTQAQIRALSQQLDSATAEIAKWPGQT